jgi:hypothetical protein
MLSVAIKPRIVSEIAKKDLEFIISNNYFFMLYTLFFNLKLQFFTKK